MKLSLMPVACFVLGSLFAAVPLADTETGGHFVFAWPFSGDDMRPRGGTTRGAEVNLVAEATQAFRRLQAEGLSKRERDRRAILAMAGPYRVSFDFLEVMGFEPGFEPHRPYQSWGTEYIYALEDQPERVVLQHLMVMTFVDDQGKSHGPIITKHWRQDWQYEAASAHTYRGDNTWKLETLPAGRRDGTWLQTVWQVSDSPRYAGWGTWTHTDAYSAWKSDTTWRPLPRREFSVRDDYDALVGVNRQTILPSGWVHEQRNQKVVVGQPGEIDKRLAVEYGVARYERIKGYDFSPGDAYLEATGPFWALVRQHWDRLLAERDVLYLKKQVDQTKLFEPLFARARAIADGDRDFDRTADERFVRETINRYVADGPDNSSGAQH